MNNPARILDYLYKVKHSGAESQDDLLGKFLTGNQSQSVRSKAE